jgi:hypothetical protein
MRTSISLVLFITGIATSAQTYNLSGSSYKHGRLNGSSFFLEMAGHSLGGSVNYDKVVLRKSDLSLTCRFGLGFCPCPIQGTTDKSYRIFSSPILVNIVYPVSKIVFLEAGVGLVNTITFWPTYSILNGTDKITYFTSSSFDCLLTLNAGIRVQTNRGFLFRAGYISLREINPYKQYRVITYLPFAPNDFYLPWFGLSFGYSYR